MIGYKFGLKASMLAAVILAAVGCGKDDDAPHCNDGIIRFTVAKESAIELESRAGESVSEPLTLTSEDGSQSLTFQRTVSRTQDSGIFQSGVLTKGTPVTGNNIDAIYDDELYVTALKGDGSIYVPKQKLMFASREEGKSESSWTTASPYYWPGENLVFWSWAPNSLMGNLSATKTSLSFSYTTPDSNGAGRDAETQSDLIVANTSANLKSGNARLIYEHALSAIRFEMENTKSLKIKSISLNGVLSQGTCTFTPDPDKQHGYEQIAWTNLSGSKTYTQDFNQNIIEGTEDAPQPIGSQEATFMVIPQCAAGGNEIGFVMTVEEGGVEKQYTAALKNEDWKAGVTYVYNIGHPVFDNYYLTYHWNDGGKHSGDQEIFKLEEYTTGGSHDIILQEPYWTPTVLDDYYSFLGWAETPYATEAEYIQPGRSETGLKTTINLVNEYTNLYAIWEKVELTDPWVDYENYITNAFGNFRIDHLDDWQFNKSITLTGQFTNGHEKIGFPIHKLIPGKWYYIKFSETLTPTKTPYNERSGIYGCTMKSSSEDIKPHQKSSMISFTTNLDPKAYVWTHTKSDAIWGNTNPNYEHEAMSDQILTFYASAETMYWVWDLSKINDVLERTYSFSHSEIQMIAEPDAPTVNMLETSLHGFKYQAITNDESHDNKRLDADCKGCSTFKVNADFTSMEMKTFGTNKYEKVNIPLINLVPGTKYKLSFNYSLNVLCKYESDDFYTNNDLCYGISTQKNTKTDKGDFHNTSSTSPYYEYSDNIASKESECGSKDYEIEFIAQESTMYWVWSMSRMADDTFYQHLFNNVSLTVIE